MDKRVQGGRGLAEGSNGPPDLLDKEDSPKLSSQKVSTLQPIIKVTKTQFVVEKEVSKVLESKFFPLMALQFSNQYSLNIVEDIYKRDFYDTEHFCFLCSGPKQEYSIVAVSSTVCLPIHFVHQFFLAYDRCSFMVFGDNKERI